MAGSISRTALRRSAGLGELSGDSEACCPGLYRIEDQGCVGMVGVHQQLLCPGERVGL